MTSVEKRLVRLEQGFKPVGCHWGAGCCVRHEVVGDGSEDPPLPHFPKMCPDCGRERSYRLIVLIGVDASRI